MRGGGGPLAGVDRATAALIIVVLFVSGCSCRPIGDRCDEPDLPPCPSGTACIDKRCQPVPDAGFGGGDAGGAAGGGAAGGSGGGPSCVPDCPVWQLCSGTTCVDRYAGLTLAAPARVRSNFTVSAQLTLASGATPNPPLTLELEARDSDGGFSLAPMSRLGDGGYLSSPISAAAETTWQLAVRWRDAGLSATASTIVDLTAPSFSVSWPAPPVRLVDVDGGLDQRDPADADAGTTSWRRDETALIRISSAASDIDPSTVRLRVAGYDVPLADAGVCVSTGGYCRVASAELWRPTWRTYRGTMPVEISAADDVGNAAMTDGGQLRVTRWRWRIDLPDLQGANRASIVGIDHAGTIYAVTSDPDGGSLNAYAPTGELVYRRATVGRPFPPVIGAVAGPNGVHHGGSW